MGNFTISEAAEGFTAMRSLEDASVNFSLPTPDGGMVEARYVRRRDDRFIVYISSMTGCDKACRFCHLTQTGQTMARNLSVDEMLAQARTVLSNSAFGPGETVHFNFMARGEPMANPAVGADLFAGLAEIARSHGLSPRMKVSTIMPEGADRDWAAFSPIGVPVDVYYSLYSMDEAWRRRWLPKAAAPQAALSALARFSKETGNRVILHWALIKGENDSPEQAVAAVAAAGAAGLRFDFNLVRYNPANAKSQEADPASIAAYLNVMSAAVQAPNRVRMIPRVGFDVAASCGMFLQAA